MMKLAHELECWVQPLVAKSIASINLASTMFSVRWEVGEKLKFRFGISRMLEAEINDYFEDK